MLLRSVEIYDKYILKLFMYGITRKDSSRTRIKMVLYDHNLRNWIPRCTIIILNYEFKVWNMAVLILPDSDQ